ncbi:MAG: flagellar protein FlgN [Burkholderiales bacterium]|nr:flagellar protein FlgN [Burkholderiales bacterium]
MLRSTSANAGPAATAANFVTTLRDECVALLAFTGLLEAEQDALVEGDADRVAGLAQQKASQIDLLSHLGALRSSYLATQNLNAGADGMLAWLGRNPGFATAVKKIWQELLALAQKAQRINQNNGALIESRLQQTRLKLAVLHSAANSEGVYRADGQLRPLHSGRSLSQG